VSAHHSTIRQVLASSVSTQKFATEPEERPGPPPPAQDDHQNGNTMRIVLVEARDGKPVAIENFDELESPN
jgi:hypothetical protein